MTELLVSSPQTRVGGESPMIDFKLWTEVYARFRQGHGKRKMARELGLDRKTVKRILAQARPAPVVSANLLHGFDHSNLQKTVRKAFPLISS
jgi:DNA-binding transcriptional regulator LsrR (DeoR family)